MKNQIKVVVVLAFALFLAACGSTPQSTVSLLSNTQTTNELKVGFVYYAPENEANTHIYGASCLLCYGVASSLTSSLDSHLEANITTDELSNIRDLVKAKYAEKYMEVVDVELPMTIKSLKKFKGEMGFARKDFTVLKESLNVDVLVVLEISEHGAFRSFSGYLPNGDPQGYLNGLVYAVDLTNNRYVQYQSIRETVQPPGDWDQPPTFPSVTTSYYQAIENVKKRLSDTM